jgi:hypothetical protein
MADAADSKSAEVNPHVGSSPTSGTTTLQKAQFWKTKITTMRRATVSLLAVLLAVSAAAAPETREIEPRGGRHAVLTPRQALTDAERAELAANGIVVGAPLSGGRHVVRVVEDATLDASRFGVIESLSVEDKVFPSAYREFAMGRTMATVNVVFHKDVPFETARTTILAAGGQLDAFRVRYSPSQRIVARVPSAALRALAADDNVLAVSGVRKMRVASENSVSAQVSHVPEVYAAPYNLSGEGVVVGVFELAGADATHTEFGGRLTVNSAGGGSGDRQHATHVSGTIGASGVRVDAKGMAPAVKIEEFCITTPCGEDLTFLDTKDEKLKPLGVIADNNSWGFILGWTQEDGFYIWNDLAEYFGAYELSLTSPIDEISNTHDILFMHSAGNEGDAPVFSDPYAQHRHVNNDGDPDTTKVYCYSANASGSDCPATCTGGCEVLKHHATEPFDTIGVTAAAKNVVTVGAITQLFGITDFSSRGPAKDGRVKPDVVARGNSVISTVPGGGYARLSGTSMATPAVTGIVALLTQQWRRTFAGTDPKPAQMKAVLIAGADDLGNAGPDYTYGFGLVNAQRAADIIIADGGAGTRIQNLTLANGTTSQQDFRINVPAGDVRVVLQWNDPAITPIRDEIAPVALVNDLDLTVVGPDGTTHRAYVLDKNAPTANATRGTNKVDNTEVVEITGAAAGVYRVVVAGTRVTAGPQNAVVVTSAPKITVAPCIDLQEPNNDAGTAYGNIVGGSAVTGGICASGDLDFYRFTATKTGPLSVTLTAGDTPLRVTITGSGISRTQDIAAGSTATLNADVNTVPNAVTIKIEAQGALGLSPTYVFTPNFGLENGKRRRSTRH